MRLASVLLGALLLAAPAAAQHTLDQVSDYHNFSGNAALPGWVWEQEVLVGISGPLSRFELSLQSYIPNDEVTVEL